MHCARKKYVYSKKLRKRVKRCASYSGGYRRRASSRRRRGGYRRGHRPFNKGRSCVSFGVNRLGRRSCRSYGGQPRTRRERAHVVYHGAGKTFMKLPGMQPFTMGREGVEGLSGYRRRSRRYR